MRKLEDDSPTDQPIADPRDVTALRVGTIVRDAAVDPRPGDFLPPTNAGQANPHGPEVVAPGIHGLETKAVLPGDVSDTGRQEARETELAARTLAGDEPVPDVVLEMADGAYDTKVDAADPAAEDRTAGQSAALAAAPTGVMDKPAGNASRAEWVAYATSPAGGMTPSEADSLTRDQLRDSYTS